MAETQVETALEASEPATEDMTGQTESQPVESAKAQDAQPEKVEQPEATVPDRTKEGKPILDPSNLPPDASQADRDYAAQMQRYFTKRTQAMAEDQKKLKTYDDFFRSGTWQEYQQWAQSRTQTPQYQQTQSTQSAQQVDQTRAYLQQQYEDALANNDYGRLLQINEAIVEHKLAQKEALYTQRINQFEQAQKRISDSMMLDDYGKVNPDFWQDHQDGAAEAFVGYYVDQKGLSLAEAHERLRAYRKRLTDRIAGSTQKRITEKRNAVAQTPTPSQSSEVIYVDTPDQERKLNFKLSMEGSNKVAKVKPRS